MVQKTKPDIRTLIAGQPLFSGLPAESIARIAQDVRELHPAKGEILFSKGDECKGLHIVVVGQIKLSFISPHGQEKVVEIIRQNHMFGEAVMFMEKPYVVSAQALTDSWVLFFPKTTIFTELERDPQLARKMLAGLAVRQHQLVNDIEGYSLHSGKKRVISYLLQEVSDNALPAEGHAFTIKLAISKNTIASRLSMTQEHFSRILHELVELGLITVQGREIHVPDIRQLQKYED
ncbi:MAG: Crp/Fnr family transcriptional regulator [Azoarcus sp.]|jgi:CRP-like cAMP-binding protein|nr:Crp/Fnr family transcriptional regulator [Azoarcus sp.]